MATRHEDSQALMGTLFTWPVKSLVAVKFEIFSQLAYFDNKMTFIRAEFGWSLSLSISSVPTFWCCSQSMVLVTVVAGHFDNR